MSDHWQRAYDQRKALRTEYKLRAQVHIRSRLAAAGWFEYPDPEGEGSWAIAHVRDLETYIVGHIMWNGVTLDPGEDLVQLRVEDFPTWDAFLAALQMEHARLVKEWY